MLLSQVLRLAAFTAGSQIRCVHMFSDSLRSQQVLRFAAFITSSQIRCVHCEVSESLRSPQVLRFAAFTARFQTGCVHHWSLWAAVWSL